MSFYQTLQAQTAEQRSYLLNAPVVQQALGEQFSLPLYVAFLSQAYHHVKHTVPLLMASGARLATEQSAVRKAIADYINEEIGHEQWILDDIAVCGVDAEAVRQGEPGFAIEMMLAFLYDQIARHNPMALFGMVLVLEGTSVQLATQVAAHVQQHLQLPDEAFSYLRSHGELDQEHIRFFERLMNSIEDPQDQQAIIHAANRVYRLYGDMLRELDTLAEHWPALLARTAEEQTS